VKYSFEVIGSWRRQPMRYSEQMATLKGGDAEIVERDGKCVEEVSISALCQCICKCTWIPPRWARLIKNLFVPA